VCVICTALKFLTNAQWISNEKDQHCTAIYTAASRNAGMDSDICDQLVVPDADTGTDNEICIFTADDAFKLFNCDVRLCDAMPIDGDARTAMSCSANEVVSHRNILKIETHANVESVTNANHGTEMQQTDIDNTCKQVAADALDSVNKMYAIDSAQSRLIPSLNSQNSILDVSTTDLAEHAHCSQTSRTNYVVSVTERCVDDDDKLLAELEEEVYYTTDAVNGLVDYGPVIQGIPRDNCDELTKDILMLRRRQTALECIHENTLESRKQLEGENIRLEQKLKTANGALEAAHCDISLLNTEVSEAHFNSSFIQLLSFGTVTVQLSCILYVVH